jgi:hypothetical protein
VTLATSEEEFDRAFRARLVELRRQQFAQLGDQAVAWLAVAPAWTERLALACGFPTGSAALAEFLARAESAGLCASHRSGSSARPAWYWTRVLLGLAPYLPEARLRRGFDAVLGIEQERTRAQALARLAPHLPAALLPQTLEAVGAVSHERVRAQALAELAPHLTELLLWEAIAASRTLESPTDRAAAMAGLAMRLPENQREAVLTEALLDAQLIGDVTERAVALVGLVPHLPEVRRHALLPAILQGVQAVGDEERQVELLTELAPALPPTLLEQALLAVQGFEDAGARAQGLVAVAAVLAEPARTELVHEALGLTGNVADATARTMTLSGMVGALTRGGSFEAALRAAEGIDEERVRAHALGTVAEAFARHGQGSRAVEIATRALEVAPAGERAQIVSAVSGVARRLAEEGEQHEAAEVAAQALSASEVMGAGAEGVRALGEVAQALAHAGAQDRAVGIVSRALDTARDITDQGERSEALLSLAPYLPAEWRTDQLDEALVAAQAVDDRSDRVQQLVNLVPHLSADKRSAVAEEALGQAEATSEELEFWMPESIRPEAIAELRHRRGPTFLEQTAVDVAVRLREAQAQAVGMPAVVARWAELAAATGELGTSGIARQLDERIAELCAVGETGRALGWVESGMLLAQVLGGELEAVALLGNRRVELLHRQAQDRRHLRHFLPRQEQLDDFRRLLDRPEEGWALHYLGMGGVGKTMLLRHINGELAPSLDAPTSRVDFDHINPDYPVRRPGQLLLELADELRSYMTTERQERLFGELQARLVRLHESLSGQPFPGDPLANIQGPEFDKALRAFCNLLELLPQPVLLILDTCEELAKRRPAGAMLPPVEATFSILERIHQQVPTLRVVFAGRRPLARSGPGWRLEETGLQEGTAQLPQRKEYLRLHEIKGFDEAEAITYLTRVKQLMLPDALRRAILARSQETGRAAAITWSPPRSAAREGRYNPFDLALYADWAREVPALDPAVIASGRSDQYVEMRIVGRFREPGVQALLPAVALLGRFDREMLRPAFSGSDEAFADAYRELGSTEWTDYQLDEALESSFLEVDRNLRPRLLAYYGEPARRRLLDAAGHRLGRGIGALVMERPLDRLGVEHVDAALRLVPADQAAGLWERLERRAADEAKWDWARAVVERVLGEGGAVGAEHPARAAVEATHCAALTHEQPEVDLAPMWREVAELAAAHPDPEVGQWLRHRAVAGQVAATRATDQRPSDEVLTGFWALLTAVSPDTAGSAAQGGTVRAEQSAGSVCAALEAVLERAERTGDAGLVPAAAVERISGWASAIAGWAPPAIAAFAWTLAGRAAALHRQWQEASASLQAAATTVVDMSIESERQRWLDWRAPASLPERVRLEAMRALPPQVGKLNLEQLRAWQQGALVRTDLIDAERLVAFALKVRLAWTVVPEDELEAVARAERYVPDRQPLCNAHREIPPLFVSLASGWLALGNGERALRLLDERIAEATRTGRDQSSVRAAQLAKAEVIRWLRLSGREPALISQLARSPRADEVTAAWPVLVLTRPPASSAVWTPQRDTPAAMLHAWWRCRPALTERAARLAVDGLLEATGRERRAGAPEGPAPPDSTINVQGRAYVVERGAGYDALSVALDWVEAARLTPKSPRPPNLRAGVRAWFARHPAEIEPMVRLALRGFALDMADIATISTASPWRAEVWEPDPPSALQRWAQAIGPRRMAELALDEGELLALRLPRDAVRLLNLAYEWFVTADDAAGALIAWTRSMIALIHGTTTWIGWGGARPAALRDSPKALQALYERLGASGRARGMPRWAELAALASDPDPRRLDTIRDPSWGDWLERMLVCLAWSTGRDRSPDTVLQQWLLGRHPEGLPLELIPQPAEPATARQRQPPAQAEAPTAPSGARERDVRAARATRGPTHIEIAGGIDGSSGPSVTLRLRQTGQESAAQAPDAARWLVEGTCSRPGPQAYRPAAAGLPISVTDGLAELQATLKNRPLHVSMHVDPALHAVAWEALLSFALPATHKVEKRVAQLRFWRVGGAVPPSVPREAAGQARRGVVCVCHARWGLLAERAWSRAARPVSVVNDVVGLEALNPARILHVIAAPVETAAGLRVRLAGASDGGGAKQSWESAVRGEGLLVQPDRLPFHRFDLVILQEEPLEGLTRLDAERERTADLRTCAAEVFMAGARAVVLLPALPAEIAESVVRLLGDRLRLAGLQADWMRWQRLLEAVTDVRTRIASASPPKEQGGPSRRHSEAGEQWVEMRLELALDLTLFARLGNA